MPVSDMEVDIRRDMLLDRRLSQDEIRTLWVHLVRIPSIIRKSQDVVQSVHWYDAGRPDLAVLWTAAMQLLSASDSATLKLVPLRDRFLALVRDADANITDRDVEDIVGDPRSGGPPGMLFHAFRRVEEQDLDFDYGSNLLKRFAKDTILNQARRILTDDQFRESMPGNLADMLQRLHLAAAAVEAIGEAEADPFDSMTSAELDDGDFALDYLIDDILVRGQPGVIGGPKKSLKTNTSADLNLSLATGRRWLDRFDVIRPVRSAIISGESGRATLQETARRIARAKGISLRDATNAHWAFKLPTLGEPGSEAALERYIESRQLDVIIIDPAYLCLQVGDDAGNLFKMGSLLKGLSGIAQRTGVTPILNHHYRKAVKVGEQPELDWLAWAGIQEWMRQWILINRRVAYDPDRGGSHKLWMSIGGSAGHGGLWGVDIEEGTRATPGGRYWDVTVTLPAEIRATAEQQRESSRAAAQRQRLDQDVATVVAYLADRPDGETRSVIANSVGMAKPRYEPAIIEAQHRGLIFAVNIRKGNKSHPGYRISPSSLTSLIESDDCCSRREQSSESYSPPSAPNR